MAIASMIVQPVTNQLNKVVEELSAISGVTVHSTTPKAEIIILIEADSLHSVNTISQEVEKLTHVLGVFPTYITTADEEENDF